MELPELTDYATMGLDELREFDHDITILRKDAFASAAHYGFIILDAHYRAVSRFLHLREMEKEIRDMKRVIAENPITVMPVDVARELESWLKRHGLKLTEDNGGYHPTFRGFGIAIEDAEDKKWGYFPDEFPEAQAELEQMAKEEKQKRSTVSG